MMRCLGLINARGNSRGVPGKNARLLGGTPLIGWSIAVARGVARLDEVAVSTDSEELAGIAREHGAEVPFMRPAELAGDEVLQIEVVRHALVYYQAMGVCWDAVVLLQPTCPLRSRGDVEACLDVYTQGNANGDEGGDVDTVITVVESNASLPNTLYVEDETGCAVPRFPATAQPGGVVRQQGERLYHRVGSVYVLSVRDALEGRLYGDRVRMVQVPPERALDIDTPYDWALLEAWVAAHGLRAGGA